ncbi:hypothetical protein [Spiroplasma endosymbiont of Apeira syringaria]|uniref:hypothetical protein n=1 Tax=Spiroplasma endosymbiont of Apeira syringaria TaxID=3066307 RepID=UPI0030CC3520
MKDKNSALKLVELWINHMTELENLNLLADVAIAQHEKQMKKSVNVNLDTKTDILKQAIDIAEINFNYYGDSKILNNENKPNSPKM